MKPLREMTKLLYVVAFECEIIFAGRLKTIPHSATSIDLG
jgi:hypothetical protein